MLADAPVPAVHTEQQPARWTLLRVGPSGRSVVIGATAGTCQGPLEAAIATQDDAAVTLTATFPTPVPDDPSEQVLCPAIFARYVVTVTLDAPLDGRALKGQARLLRWRQAPPASLPRLIGARARDALVGLRNQGYTVHLAGPIDGEVVREQYSGRRQSGRDVTVVAAPRR